MESKGFTENPYKPGAGHRPPFLAGRKEEQSQFAELLKQRVILKNMLLMGLRGVGKTVLLEELKEAAMKSNWAWVGSDLSEAASTDELRMAQRLVTDIALVTSRIKIDSKIEKSAGFLQAKTVVNRYLDYQALVDLYNALSGLPIDRLKEIVKISWIAISSFAPKVEGVVFAYDEAQNMANHPAKEQYPTSLLLDLFQSIQRQDIPAMLVLVGLPTLQKKLIEARTYFERMFETIDLCKLNDKDSTEAILIPLKDKQVGFTDLSVKTIKQMSDGYPYFIQYICKEAFDRFGELESEGREPIVPREEIIAKLDRDFYRRRWDKPTERQKELLAAIAHIDGHEDGFTVQEISEKTKSFLEKPIKSNQVSQMLTALTEMHFVFKRSHGKYFFAVPMLGDFIKRETENWEKIQPGLLNRKNAGEMDSPSASKTPE